MATADKDLERGLEIPDLFLESDLSRGIVAWDGQNDLQNPR